MGCGPRQTQVQQIAPTQAPPPPAQQQPAAPAQQQPAAPAQPQPAASDPARLIRKVVFLSNAQAQDPQEFELSRLVAEDFKKLGLDVEHRALPFEQQSNVVWYNRDKGWDMTSWRMVGRPERLDPDEFIFNLYHSSTATDGYNFIGYLNPEYDKLAEAQRSATDPTQRQAIIRQAQEVIARDQPYGFYVNPRVAFAYNNQVWDPGSIVEAKGIGIKNFWTFVKATPKGNQKDMVLNAFDTIKAINPLYISGGTDSWVTELIWDRLMRIDENGLAKPWAAEKVEWKDQTTVDVTLRQGMKWHDGQPVTADDVIFSFTAPAGDASPMYKPFVSRIDKVEGTGGNVIRFKLKSAYVPFEAASLAKVNLIPKHIWEPILADLKAKGVNAETYQEEKPIGSGPFKFVSWQKAEQVVLEANKDHWAAPKMNRWVLRFIANVEAVLGQINSGELNFLSEYRGDYTVLQDRVQKDSKLTMVTTTEVGMRFLAYNERRAPFNDPAFRRALSNAINRDAIVKQVYKGFAVVADSPVSPALDFWRPAKLDAPGYDLEKAKQILKDAGYEWDAQGKLMYPKGKTETVPVAP
ncbi:MAG: twin-arginine translocation pathway signal protein [Anaerolineae bacterium]|nr:twin-arginine translocation pathway signal protein [Anaerolineae bacterium]